jgi:hypothetical protein
MIREYSWTDVAKATSERSYGETLVQAVDESSRVCRVLAQQLIDAYGFIFRLLPPAQSLEQRESRERLHFGVLQRQVTIKNSLDVPIR